MQVASGIIAKQQVHFVCTVRQIKAGKWLIILSKGNEIKKKLKISSRLMLHGIKGGFASHRVSGS